MLDLVITKKGGEKRIALTNEEKLVEFYVEENIDTRNEGNIFVGIVKDVLVGMDIISLGDFVISNKEDKSEFSFTI